MKWFYDLKVKEGMHNSYLIYLLQQKTSNKNNTHSIHERMSACG